MSKFHLFTLGCKINQYETEAIKEAWERYGFELEEDPRRAEWLIVNTCAVTDRAVQDVRKVVRRFVRENHKIKVILTGCAVSSFERELKDLPNIHMLVPQERKRELLVPFRDTFEVGGCDFKIRDFLRARAVVKIQDGCSYFCSYCIVPYTRGRPVSRDPEDIKDEVIRLIENGFREIVLSGINLGQFKHNSEDLWDFLEWLEERIYRRYKDLIRFRLSSLDPSLLNDKALRFIEKSKLLCPHLHISVQSASERILRLMNRHTYKPSDIKRFINSLSNVWDVFGLSGDFLVGFPTETEEDFLETYKFCEELPFTHGHVFSFSPRPKTKAYNMEGQVDWKIKKQRNRKLRELFEKKKQKFIEFLCDKKRVLDVVIEEDGDFLGGMCEYYIYCRFEKSLKLKRKERVRAFALEPLKGEIKVGMYESS